MFLTSEPSPSWPPTPAGKTVYLDISQLSQDAACKLGAVLHCWNVQHLQKKGEGGLRVWSTCGGDTQHACDMKATLRGPERHPNIPITHTTSDNGVFSAQNLNKNQSANDSVFISYQLNQGHKRLKCHSSGQCEEFRRPEGVPETVEELNPGF